MTTSPTYAHKYTECTILTRTYRVSLPVNQHLAVVARRRFRVRDPLHDAGVGEMHPPLLDSRRCLVGRVLLEIRDLHSVRGEEFLDDRVDARSDTGRVAVLQNLLLRVSVRFRRLALGLRKWLPGRERGV